MNEEQLVKRILEGLKMKANVVILNYTPSEEFMSDLFWALDDARIHGLEMSDSASSSSEILEYMKGVETVVITQRVNNPKHSNEAVNKIIKNAVAEDKNIVLIADLFDISIEDRKTAWEFISAK